MSNEIAVVNIQARLPMPSGIGGEMDARKWRVLCESVFPSAKTPEAIVMALDYCTARKLDPFKRPVNIVPMWNKTLGREVETIWPGINEVQTTASRTGKYAGMDEPKWGPDVTRTFEGIAKYKDDRGNWKEDNLKIELTFPEWCSVTVYRIVEGQRCAFTEPVFWTEAYGRRGKTEVPNDMWAKRPKGQVLKVAKAAALRAAFPEEGEYTSEEMEGKEIEHGGIVIEGAITSASQPKSPFAKAVLRKQFQENVRKAFNDTRSLAELAELAALYKPKFDEMEAGGHEHDMLLLDDLRTCYQTCANRFRVGAQHDEETGEVYPSADDFPPEILADVIRENALAAQSQSPDGVVPEFLQPGFKRSTTNVGA